jgi:tetratricopeptide (TPR) repeat protein
MKNKIHHILFVVIFAQAQLIAQNYEDMSKRELRKVVPQFLNQTDSLKQENIVLRQQVLDFKNKLDNLREDVIVGNKRLNNGINRLKDSIIKINKAFSLYKDSIGSIKIARLYTPSGAWIFCDWSDRTPRDSCTFSFSDSTFYKGGLMGTINGKYIDYYLHGHGVMTIKRFKRDGVETKYIGNWKKSKYDGIGTLILESLIFQNPNDSNDFFPKTVTYEGRFIDGELGGGKTTDVVSSPGAGFVEISWGFNQISLQPYGGQEIPDFFQWTPGMISYKSVNGTAHVGPGGSFFSGPNGKNVTTIEAYYKIGLATDILVFGGPVVEDVNDFSKYIDLPVSNEKKGIVDKTDGRETINPEAKAYYKKAISLRPINTEDYLYRALSKQRLKDYTGAINDFTKAIELNPKNRIAYNNRAYTKIILKDLSGACEDWKKFEDLGGIVDEESKNEFCK